MLARCGSTLDQSFPSTFGSAARAITKGRGVTRDREWSSSKVSDLIPAIGGCLSGEAHGVHRRDGASGVGGCNAAGEEGAGAVGSRYQPICGSCSAVSVRPPRLGVKAAARRFAINFAIGQAPSLDADRSDQDWRPWGPGGVGYALRTKSDGAQPNFSACPRSTIDTSERSFSSAADTARSGGQGVASSNLASPTVKVLVRAVSH